MELLDYCSDQLRNSQTGSSKDFQTFYTLDGVQLRTFQELKDFCENDDYWQGVGCRKLTSREGKRTKAINADLDDNTEYEADSFHEWSANDPSEVSQHRKPAKSPAKVRIEKKGLVTLKSRNQQP